MTSRGIYVLGGYQTDFSRNWARERKHVGAMIHEALLEGLQVCQLAASDIQVGHVGNFAAELYCKQGHLGAFLPEVDPVLDGLPTARHEAACASGSVAILAALAELQAGWYDLSCVVGVEQMKTVSAAKGSDFLGTASWYEREALNVEFPFPKLFGNLAQAYDARYGLRDEHLAAIATLNYANAKLNPIAQTRTWYMSQAHAESQGEFNPQISNRVRASDCSQVTDGAAAIFLASEDFAKRYAARRSIALESIPRIKGWGQRTARLTLEDKLIASKTSEYLFPQVRATIEDAWRRAGVSGIDQIDGVETHDCFTISEYMAIDHFGITPPGASWRAIEEGWLELDGRYPMNPSGGLIGAGHPVGCTGVRQVLDCYKQVTETAGDYQVAGARTFQTLNLGGSGTTSVSFIVGR